MTRRRETSVNWKKIVPATLGVLTIPFALGYAIAVFVLFPAPKVQPGSNGIAVPNLIGRSVTEAQSLLATAGLGALDTMMLPHPNVAAGDILAQDPLPGQQLRAGSKVSVSVSNGAPQLRVPNVEGFTADAAEQVLKRMGFDTQRTDEVSTARIGTVTRLEPMAGASVRLPSTVTIWISSGMPSPDSLGITRDTIHAQGQH